MIISFAIRKIMKNTSDISMKIQCDGITMIYILINKTDFKYTHIISMIKGQSGTSVPTSLL